MKKGNLRIFGRRIATVIAAASIVVSSFAAVISAQSMKPQRSRKAATLTEDQRILHVLNRLGFGARPGDVERVRAMGVDNYISQQLYPEKIDDSATEAKLKNLETLRMSTAELYEKYPQPGQLLQQLQRRGALPADLVAAQQARTKAGANATTTAASSPNTGGTMSGEMQGPSTAKTEGAAPPKPVTP